MKMTSKDWVEYFELTEGRQPTSQEYKEALERGDFERQNDTDAISHDSASIHQEPVSELPVIQDLKKETLKKRNLLIGAALGLLAVFLVFYFRNENKSFTQEYFTNNEWVIIRGDSSKEDEFSFDIGDWSDAFEAMSDGSDMKLSGKLRYSSFNQYDDVSKAVRDEFSDLSTAHEVVEQIQDYLGKRAIDAQDLMIISKGDFFGVFYWLNKDEAVVFVPYTSYDSDVINEIVITKKQTPIEGISGEYILSDIVLSKDLSVAKDGDTSNLNKTVLSANSSQATLMGTNHVASMSLDSLLTLMQILEVDEKDFKDLEEVNEVLGKADHGVEHLDDVQMVFIDSDDDFTFNQLEVTNMMLLVVENDGNRVHLIPAVSGSHFDYDGLVESLSADYLLERKS